MKKLLFLVLFIFLCFSSCNFFMQEEYGEVIIDLDGSSSRAIGNNCLPEISSAKLYLQIIGQKSGIIEKNFEAETPKLFSANFPIGEKLKIRARLSVLSASWEASINHTVSKGTNNVILKLNKMASAYKRIEFSIGKSDGTASVTHKLRFDKGPDIGINAAIPPTGSQGLPGFARDSKGRLYFIYKDASHRKIKRFTSEGLEDTAYNDSPLTSSLTGDETEIFSDRSNGNIYVLDKQRSGNKLYRTDGTSDINIEIPSIFQTSPDDKIKRMAVYNKFCFIVDGSNKLHSYTFNGTKISDTPIESLDLFKDLIKINSSYIPANSFKTKDIFVNKDKLYVLFSVFSSDSTDVAYSLGGILEYAYNEEGKLTPARKLGFSQTIGTGADSIAHIDDTSNFYGAAKVIGFEDEKIYIADDGYKLKKEGTAVVIEKNENRIASLNTVSASLSFESTKYTWFEEKQEADPPLPPSPPTPVPPGKMIVWTKNGTTGYKFYELAADDLNISGKTPLITASGNDYPLDVFSFDKDGNLYVVWKNNNNKYEVRRYLWLKANSEYSNSHTKIKLKDKDEFSLSTEPKAIAVHLTAENSYFYYVYKGTDKHNYILRFTWNNESHNFSSSTFDVSYQKKIQDDGTPGKEKTCTALAADLNGLFASVIEETDSNYDIKINKYGHTGTDKSSKQIISDPASGGGGNADIYYKQAINDMYIKDGALYILTAQYKGRLDSTNTTKVSVGGSLLKLEGLSGNIQDSTLTNLWPSGDIDELKEDYAPYRFIKTGNDQMVIASDGYKGNKTETPKCTQLNKLVFFKKTGSSAQWQYETVKDTDAEFSKELNYTGGRFKWE